jgi:hypothetical protein
VSRRIFEKLEGEIDECLNVLVARAKEGSSADLRFLISLYTPRARSAPVDIGGDSFGDLADAESLEQTHAALLRAAASGRIGSDEASALSSLLNEQRKFLETTQLAKRLQRLEAGAAPVINLKSIDDPEGEAD